MSSLKLKLAAFGAALFLALPAAPALAQAAKPLAKLSFRLDWKPSGSHSPFYVGKALGYYAEEGIDLDIIPGSGSSDSIKQLGSGSVDMALADALVLVQAGEQRVPVKSVAAYYARTPIAVISPKAKPLASVAQLTSGARIGAKRASSTYQGLAALLAANRIDARQVNIVDIGFGVQPLLVGQVDALLGFSMNEAIEAESAGMPVQEMLIADHGVAAYGLMLATGDRFLKARPELVGAFLRATRRAVQYAAAHPAEAVAALAKSASEMDAARETKVLAKTIPFWSAPGKDLSTFGEQSLAGWQQTADTAQRVGLVEKTPSVKDLYADGYPK